MASTTKNPNPAAATQTTQPNVQTAVSGALSAANSVATQRLQTFGQLHQARIARLTRAAASLSAQGDAGAVSLAQTHAQIAAEKTIVAKIAVVGQQAAIAAPQVAASGWALHGRVYSSDLVPVPSATVFLVDAEKTYQNAYGFSYTDATGYFLINFPGTPPQSATPAAGAQTSAATGSAPQLFVAVANASGQPVYLATTAFTPTLGVATYQVLPVSGTPIGDPPADIRKVALPPAPAKKSS